MKLLVIKDPHFRKGFGSPESRVDDYDDVIEDKLSQIEKISKDKGIDYIVFTGDVLDKKYPSSYSFGAIMSNLELIEKIKGFSKKGILSIAGNHDLPYSSYDNVNNSVYKLAMSHLKDISYSKIEDDKTSVYGIPYVEHDKVMDEISKINEQADPEKSNVVVLHEHFIPFDSEIGDLKYSSFFKYTDVKKFSNIKFFVYGHLHKGFEPRNYELEGGNSQWHINPYSLYRLARNYYTVSGEHVPEVTYIDTESEDVYNIKLKVGDFSIVFDRNLLNQETENDENLNKYIQSISSILKSLFIESSNFLSLSDSSSILDSRTAFSLSSCSFWSLYSCSVFIHPFLCL